MQAQRKWTAKRIIAYAMGGSALVALMLAVVPSARRYLRIMRM
jgi:hypothetical protein